MTERIFRSIIFAVCTALLIGLVIITGVFSEHFTNLQNERLETELDFVCTAVESMGMEYLESVISDDYRIGWITENGKIIFDSRRSAYDGKIIEKLVYKGETHARTDDSLTQKTLYGAKQMADDSVIIISVKHSTVFGLIVNAIQPIMVVILLAAVLCIVFANSISVKIVNPLNNLNLDNPMENNSYKELRPLLRRIDYLHKEIDEGLSELKRKNDEFLQITRNMNEGIVLLNEKSVIVSINPAASKIFEVDYDCTGRMFITIDRNREVWEAVKEAYETGHKEIVRERNGKIYQFDVTRIEYDGKLGGAAVLAFDITQQALAQKSRREFSANVSHELKTPLQSIMGSAELIENGLVKDDDLPKFIRNIRTESSRLLSLIEDIIRLSRLDEEDNMPMEPVNLYETAEDVICHLEDAAFNKKISLHLSGDSCEVYGVDRLIYEIIYNLCDNAIRYNNEGGDVFVNISQGQGNITLSVKDTGIGIDESHQDRIFERFYRVDKSHSRASGGTGLGLSIVKHAVMYHNAKINISSKIGEGTEISVVFPNN